MDSADDKLKKIATSANEQREKYGLPRIEEAAFDIKLISKEQAEKITQADPHKPNEPRELSELKAEEKEDKKMALLYLIPLAISIAAVIISLLSLR